MVTCPIGTSLFPVCQAAWFRVWQRPPACSGVGVSEYMQLAFRSQDAVVLGSLGVLWHWLIIALSFDYRVVTWTVIVHPTILGPV